MLNEKGEIIGTHPGALLFTIGERHGFTITEKGTHDAPYYVVSKDVKKNTITVSNRHRGNLAYSSMKKISIVSVNWTREIPKRGMKLQARGRYRQLLEDIAIDSASRTRATVTFKRAQDTLTPGQSLVIYKGEECIGGGVIK